VTKAASLTGEEIPIFLARPIQPGREMKVIRKLTADRIANSPSMALIQNKDL